MKIAETTPTANSPRFQLSPKLIDAAQEFESLMLKELLKPLSDSKNDFGGSEEKDTTFDTFSSFGTEAVAKELATKGGLGIANQIVSHLSHGERNKNFYSTKVSSVAADTFK